MTGPLLVALAQAQDPAAEKHRLSDELALAGQRNVWSGVDRIYSRLLDLPVALSPSDHLLGAHAAMADGRTLLAWYRLRRVRGATTPLDSAREFDPVQAAARDTAARDLDYLESRFGLVAISVGETAVPALDREEMPFAEQERDAVLAAQERVRVDRAYRGLLPIGRYAIDAVTFQVHAADGWQVVVVGER